MHVFIRFSQVANAYCQINLLFLSFVLIEYFL